MKIGVTGSSGSIGKLLVPLLKENGHDVIKFVRRKPAGAVSYTHLTLPTICSV